MALARPYNGRLIDWTGVLYYNGFRFPSQVKVRVDSTPVYDTSKRTTKYVKYVLHVDFVVTSEDWIASSGSADPGGTCDLNMTMLRRRLVQTGAELCFKGQGFGTLWVNKDRACSPLLHSRPDDGTYSGAVDAIFGPHPQVLVCEPLGSNLAWRVTWACEVTVPECCSTGNNPFGQNLAGMYEISYDQSWTIDENGLTVRTTTATIEALAYRLSGGALTLLNVNDLRGSFLPPVPLGFTRNWTYQLDRSKRRLEIVLIDREIASDVPYFANTVNASIVCSVDGDPLSYQWSATCGGSVTVAPGVPKSVAFSAFMSVLLDRFNRGFGVPIVNILNEQSQPESQPGFCLMERVAITEDIFSRVVSFDFAWMVLTSIDRIFDSTGILSPPANIPASPGGWQLWKDSITPNVLNPGGYAQMGTLSTDDRVQSACDTIQPLYPNSIRYLSYPQSYYQPITQPTVTPENSYAYFKYYVRVIRVNNVVTSPVISQMSSSEITPNSPNSQGMYSTSSNSPSTITQSSASPDQLDQTTQTRGPARYYLEFSGHAVRINHKIPLPKITAISGGAEPPIPFYCDASDELLEKTTAGPVWGKNWKILYAIPFTPTGDIIATIEHDGKLITKTAVKSY